MTADKSRQVDNLVAAIEAFTDAKIHKAHGTERAHWNPHDVDETREHMRDKLVELLEGAR